MLKLHALWQNSKAKILFLGTLIPVFILLYVNLGRDTLFNWDEGIYAELGRSLITKEGSLLTPSWNNELWLEKPPAIAWVTALSMTIFGVNEFGARALMPVFAGLTLAFVYLIGKKLADWRFGQLAMSLLATFDLFLSRARAVNTDGMLLAALTGTMYLALSRAPAFWVATGLALGIFAKGPAGLLVALIISPLLIKSGLRYFLRIAVFTIGLILPWHLYQYLVNGSSFYVPYILEQVVTRATVPIEFHMESRWYYFEFLKENLQGGTLYLLLFALGFILYQLLKTKKFPKSVILVWWLLVPLAIFTLAKTRLYWYILPIYPSISLLIAYLFMQFSKTKLLRQMLLIMIIGVSLQASLSVSRSVEVSRQTAAVPHDVALATLVRAHPGDTLAILVPESERVAEAILPADQRIGSSFRYGGSPSLVFYSQKHVTYYYNVDEWINALTTQETPTLFAKSDLPRLPKGYVVESINQTHALAVKGEDDIR